MRRNRFVFWLGEPSPHQSAYIAALADLLPQERIVAVFQRRLQSERLAMGWRVPNLARLDIVMAPDAKTIATIAGREPAASVHIFGGLRLPMMQAGLKAASRTRALVGVVSEAREDRGALGRLRILHSYLVERPYRDSVDFVLAIGRAAVRWYERCGYATPRIFPWAYVVERPELAVASRRRWPEVVISYVGRCDPDKDLDTLLRALASLRPLVWTLQIVGDGSERRRLHALAQSLGLGRQVRFVGVRDNAAVWSTLRESDLLVLPSRFDGWGAVVNEALMSGTPVVCSDRCGAADLLTAHWFGETFEAGSVDALTRALRRWIRKGPLPEGRRAEIRAWSQCIEGRALAHYLAAIIEHIDEAKTRPLAPWLAEPPTAPRSFVAATHAWNA